MQNVTISSTTIVTTFLTQNVTDFVNAKCNSAKYNNSSDQVLPVKYKLHLYALCAKGYPLSKKTFSTASIV